MNKLKKKIVHLLHSVTKDFANYYKNADNIIITRRTEIPLLLRKFSDDESALVGIKNFLRKSHVKRKIIRNSRDFPHAYKRDRRAHMSDFSRHY